MKTLRILILGLLAIAMVAQAQTLPLGADRLHRPRPNGSSVFGAHGASQSLVQTMARPMSLTYVPAVPIAETNTPEIQALADGLQDNPVRIFNYVHDHVRYVLYFGSKKGAELTLLEKSGNDFDQCALLVAMLRAAGYTNAAYQFGWQLLPYDNADGSHRDLHHWLQLNITNSLTAWTNTANYLDNLVYYYRGYPDDDALQDGNTFLFQRVWVTLTIGSTNYYLDPAFKVSEPVSGISLTTAMGGSSTTISNSLLSVEGGTDNANYCSGLNEANLRGSLTGYTTNLLNYLQSNSPNASVLQVLGGWQIIPSTNTVLPQSLIFATTNLAGTMPVISWANEPTNMMSTLSVTFANNTNHQWFIPQLQGQRLSLVNSNALMQLWQDDALLAQSSATPSQTNVIVDIYHPVGNWDETNNVYLSANYVNITNTTVYQLTNAVYALIYAFEPDWGWLQERQNKLNAYIQQGLTNGTRQVESETLNIMGLNFLLQETKMEEMLAPQLEILPMYYHHFGRMAQELGRGYYVDAYMNYPGDITSSPDDISLNFRRENTFAFVLNNFASALEHGIIEQLQNTNLVGASTVKMLQIANTNGQSVYLASSANWSSINGSLINYGGTLSQIYNQYVSLGFYVLLPANGSNHVTSATGTWAGYGYEADYTISNEIEAVEMIIAGGYHGGFSDDPTIPIDPIFVDTSGNSQPGLFSSTPLWTEFVTIADPVDAADGTFQVEHTDLSLGQAEPRGISLSCYYNGSRRFSNPTGMTGGWVHNYAINVATIAAPQAGWGGTTPQQAAPMLTATAAAIATYNSTTADAKNWLTTALISKWGIDQLTKSGASVNLGKDTLQFVKQPNGVFTPPANCTATLTQNNSAYSLLLRHGNTFNFDSHGRLTNIVDQYNNALNVTYNASNWVSTVKDWKGRQFTFNYTGTPQRLTSVTDGTRTVYYGYATTYNSQGDLTSFTDAEGKISTYVYDTNHQITATLDALSRLVVTNLYNSQGHITAQYTQGLTNKTWNIFWSGWQTTEIDPAGGQQMYFYDDQSRLVAQVDALGNTNRTFYDGQNHVIATVSPLNETNQFFYDSSNNVVQRIDALGFTNQYFYDGNNKLYKNIDARGNASSFGYNTQFSVTGQTNGAGDWVNYAYNSDGTLYTRTDSSGGTTTYGYDSTYRQLNSITYPGSLGAESFANSYFGDVTNHTDARGFATSFQYNNRRQLTNSVAPTNLVTSVSFDAVGNAVTTTDARGNALTNIWSVTQHLLATALPTTPQGSPIVTNIYDNRDLLVQTLDPYQRPTLYTNDIAGRLISITDPLSRTSTAGYDPDGHKLFAANASHETNSQTWDARGSLITLTDGAGHYSTRVYDSAGNQVTLTNRNGYAWHFYFDGANRLTNTVTPKGYSTTLTFNHQGLPSKVIDQANQTTSFYYDTKNRLTNRYDFINTFYAYDGNNNRTSVVENGYTNSWSYDAYNRVSSYQDILGHLIQYRYDANGNVTNLIYPGNHTVTYFYDTLNRMTNVTDWSGRKTTIAYDLDSRVTSIIRPNGSYRTVNYDVAGQATNILEQMSNSLPIALFRLNWTNTGNMAWEFAAPLPHPATVPTRTMNYDPDNRLQTVNGISVVNDNDGNLTSGPLTNGVFATFTYDPRNRLSNVGGVTNVYDALNNRIGQLIGTNSTAYVINPNAKLPQVLMRSKNSVTNYYIYGSGLLYQITEKAAGTNTLTYHYDYRGSTIALSADNGLVTDRVEYSAYGLTTYRAGTNDTPFLFNGRFGVQSDLNGLLYMRARYYNPFLGRFINPDPTGFSGGLNVFAYANGNPVSYLDPFGLSPDWGRVSTGVGEFGLSIFGMVGSLTLEPFTFGGSTVGVLGSGYLWTQGMVDIAGGAVNNPVSIPSNPGAAVGANFGETGQDVGGLLWDLTSLKSSSADFMESVMNGESLGQDAMKFGPFGSDAMSVGQELYDNGPEAYPSLVNIGVGNPAINGGLGFGNSLNPRSMDLSGWISLPPLQPSAAVIPFSFGQSSSSPTGKPIN